MGSGLEGGQWFNKKNESFVIFFSLHQSGLRLVNFVDLLQEPTFGFLAFHYYVSVLSDFWLALSYLPLLSQVSFALLFLVCEGGH